MTTEKNELPRCGECGGRVEMRATSGRTREYRRGVPLAVPDDFLVPTCVRCGEEYMTPAISESLDAILKREYLRKQVRHCEVCVKLIRERHGVTQQEIEDALGITRSYLSHLLAGSKEASLQMVRQLTAFAVSPEAFEAAMSIVFIDGPAEIFAGLFAVATCRRFPQRVDGFAKPGAYRNNWTPQKGANGHGKHTGT